MISPISRISKCIILPLKYYKRQDFGGMHETAEMMHDANNKLKTGSKYIITYDTSNKLISYT